MKYKDQAKQAPVETFFKAIKYSVEKSLDGEFCDDLLMRSHLHYFLADSDLMRPLTKGRGLEDGKVPPDLFSPGLWMAFGRDLLEAWLTGYQTGRHDGNVTHGVESGSGPKGRKGKLGKLRAAIVAISEDIHSKSPEDILDALEDENCVEDLYGASPEPKIDVHFFEIDRVERTVNYSRRDGTDETRSLKTIENYIAKL